MRGPNGNSWWRQCVCGDLEYVHPLIGHVFRWNWKWVTDHDER
jgi:hypothetical protein